MNQPHIVFCTTCKGRRQHIEKTLPKNLADNEDYPNCRFVLLDYNSPDQLKEYLIAEHMPAIESGRLIVYTADYMGPTFRMAHAKNMAHRLGILEGGDILVNLDADNYTGQGFASYIAGTLQPGTFLWSRMRFGTDGTPRGISGRIVVSKGAFLKTGGYDEQYAAWGPDDKDFNVRLRRLGERAVEIDRVYLKAVLHNDNMRFRECPEARTSLMEDQVDTEAVNQSDSTIVNFGRVGMGTAFRNFSEDQTVLGPVPTRIFGVGMHKTATTSLHHALGILGFESAHWKSAHWAKVIFDEMHSFEHRSITLEHHYALSDLPIGILYGELDRSYPGSKFILTTRDEARWIQSVKSHWSRDSNKFRAAWDTDPFTHRLHREVYGQKNFDAEIFLARFRQHNADVRFHFLGRPNDLLVMNMDKGAGWQELCGFLRVPVPAVPYPAALVTRPAADLGSGI